MVLFQYLEIVRVDLANTHVLWEEFLPLDQEENTIWPIEEEDGFRFLPEKLNQLVAKISSNLILVWIYDLLPVGSPLITNQLYIHYVSFGNITAV